MQRTALITLIFFTATSTASALYSVANEGQWPKSWPEELEPLRKQARTLVGPVVAQRHYAIPFNDRESFEAAWPQLLKVKTAGAPIILLRGENFFLGKGKQAGIVIHSPPEDHPEKPSRQVSAKDYWRDTTYIELVVDGDIVDLNRIPLPKETPIVDKRFDKK